MKQICSVSLWLFLCLFAVACNDENEIYFTQDEIVQGDIITGKQIRLDGNTLTVYTEGGGYVNIQGAKGEIHATSSAENIATVTVSQEGGNKVLVTPVAVGKSYVTITDAEGSSSGFAVEVKDEDELWALKSTISFISGKAECVVEGVSSTDSATIVADALSRNIEESALSIKARSYLLGGTAKRLYAYGADKQLLYKGLFTIEPVEEGLNRLNVSDKGELITHFLMDQRASYYLIKDLTEEYKAQAPYSTVTKVWLYLKFTNTTM